jgi:hypothetical protein
VIKFLQHLCEYLYHEAKYQYATINIGGSVLRAVSLAAQRHLHVEEFYNEPQQKRTAARRRDGFCR